MCLAQGPQRSDAGEARTRGPSVSSQALYHWAPARDYKPVKYLYLFKISVPSYVRKIGSGARLDGPKNNNKKHHILTCNMSIPKDHNGSVFVLIF